jgi:hypothetical protein
MQIGKNFFNMKKIILLLSILLFLFSCVTEQVQFPEFDMTVDSLTYRVGDVVKFKLKGNPDIISFYSGETGNSYLYSNQDRIVQAIAKVSFQSQNRSQSYSASDAGSDFCQENQFRVMISTDFNGQYDETSVKNANWSDITDLFTIGPASCISTSSYIPAGVGELNDYIGNEESFYIAFKYINQPNAENGNCNIWRFSSFELNAVSDNGSIPIATQVSASWSPVFMGPDWNPTRGFSTSATNVTMRADPAYRDIYQELWCISKAFSFEKEINVGTDKAIGIKTLSDVPLESYSYVFNKEGTYTITFLAVNTSIYGRKEIVKQVEINVMP